MSELKVAIMTGTGQGIGRGCAIEMAKAGYKLALMSPSDRSIELAEELGGIGRSGSVLDVDDLQALVDDAMSAYGRIDAVVSNMGHGGGVPEAIKTVGFDPDFDGPLLELSDELWHESLDMYVLNVVKLARLITPIMIKQDGGSFVNISSMNTVEPRAPYPMSMLRGALHSFAKLFGDRYARYNINMNNLMPGFCENVNLSEFARQSIPAQRPARFEEIGQACVFLASEGARYINGQNILSDGGMNRAVR
ncbi:MAG: SDR family oxidoreductase [Rhizobiaceae bacterium]|nr:SDR family oxidoreductase [Hyphomicrobiales bacterium]NRB30645.1 SDR family oxidoreductase [Rhizobiaceae bacterium]